MFEGDLTGLDDTALLDASAEFGAACDHAETRRLEAALVFADRNHEPHRPATGQILPGMERIKVYGGDGCPGVAEFAPVEFGARNRMTATAAASFIGEALALRHRLPRVWARVLAGQAQPWRARRIAHACLTVSRQAAALVDAQVESIVNTVSNYRLRRIVQAAVWQADPDAAQRAADEMLRARGVWLGQSDQYGTKELWAKLATADAIRFDAYLQELADALAVLGDTDSIDRRRAKAIGWAADPDAAAELRAEARRIHAAASVDDPDPTGEPDPMDEPDLVDEPGPADEPVPTDEPDQGDDDAADDPHHTDHTDADSGVDTDRGTSADGSDGDGASAGDGAANPFSGRAGLNQRLADIKARARTRAPHPVHVHLTDLTLATGQGVLRVEDIGPMLASQLAELLGHDKVVVKPVIDLRDQISVDAYEVPHRLRERIRLTHPVTTFPWSSHETTTRTDIDHIVPYDDTGPPGQTNTQNLTPLSRFQHRLKTFGGWNGRRLPGGAMEWTSPRGARYRVDHTGTHYLGNAAPGPAAPGSAASGPAARGPAAGGPEAGDPEARGPAA